VAERSTPPLDSVLIPAEEVGARAVELLMRKIEGEHVPDASRLAPRLTLRASSATAPVPAASAPARSGSAASASAASASGPTAPGAIMTSRS
jgi:hypothetical protein